MTLSDQEKTWLRSINEALKWVAIDAQVVDDNPHASILASISSVLLGKATSGMIDGQRVCGYLQASADHFYDLKWLPEHEDFNKHLAATIYVAAAILKGLPSSSDEVEKLIAGICLR